MNRISLVLVLSFALVPLALGGNDGESTIWVTNLHGAIDSGWVVDFPTASSDYFTNGHSVTPGTGNSDGLVDGLPITGIAVSVADFSSGLKFPMVGVFYSNLNIDPSGITPDLSKPISSVANPPLPHTNLFEFVPFDLPENKIAPGTHTVNTVVQLTPGDSGLLGVGADDTTSSARVSAYTQDGFVTPAIVLSFLDFGMNPGQDNLTTTSCKPADRLPNGRLRISGFPSAEVGAGDHVTTTVVAGSPVTLSFFGNQTGDRLRIFASTPSCGPGTPIGPALSALPDPDGDGAYLRVSAVWPFGYSGSTFQFSAVWGNEGCPVQGVGFTNCVTLINRTEVFGIRDDGTIESGWVVQFPTGPSDYFNNDFGLVPPSVNNVVALSLSVLDFVTAVPAFPQAGISDANLALDPTGHTPDMTGPGLLSVIAPFTFPSGSFERTSGQYTSHICPLPVPASSFVSHAHGWVQLTPGDSGLLGIGADQDTPPLGYSFETLDGYSSPAMSFFQVWGIRLTTN